MSHTLYFTRMDANEVFKFLSKAEPLLFNCRWHMSMPFDDKRTHNVYCELRREDLAATQEGLGQIAAGFSPAIEWKLLPDRL